MRHWKSKPWKKSVKPRATSGVKRALTRRGDYCGDKEKWRELSRQVKARDNWTCRQCKRHVTELKPDECLEADHIVRISRGGQDVLSNLWCLCSTCHAKRPGHSHLKNRRT